MMKRKALSKKTRFEVFKRDGFKCQYCGKSAPDVVLEVDHIVPVCKGGDNNMLNLLTACFDCNHGKSGNELSDRSVVKQQITQLQELNERREQLEMVANWRKEVLALESHKVEVIHRELCSRYGVDNLTETSKKTILQWVTKNDMQAVFSAVDKAFSKQGASPGQIFASIGKILGAQKYTEAQQKLLYCRGILRNRLNGSYYNDKLAIILLTNAHNHGYTLETIEDTLKQVTTWAEFKQWITAYEDSDTSS